MIILQLKANIILNLFLLAFFFYYKYLSGVLINLDYLFYKPNFSIPAKISLTILSRSQLFTITTIFALE